MTFYTGPVAFAVLLPFALITEFHVFADMLATRPTATIGFLLGSCCIAVVYNVVLFQASRAKHWPPPLTARDLSPRDRSRAPPAEPPHAIACGRLPPTIVWPGRGAVWTLLSPT